MSPTSVPWTLLIPYPVACVASVSVGLSAGLKHFSLFERAKLGASAKNVESVALAPIFALPKSETSNGRKSLRKRLPRRLRTLGQERGDRKRRVPGKEVEISHPQKRGYQLSKVKSHLFSLFQALVNLTVTGKCPRVGMERYINPRPYI